MPNNLADQIGLIGAVALLLILLTVSVVYIFKTIVASIFSTRLRTPPDNLNTTIAEAVAKFNEKRKDQDGPGPQIMLPSFAKKTPAVRRALILSSKVPAHYNTYFGNRRMKLAAEDAAVEPTFAPGNETQEQSKNIIFGFFHPYANAGGGGERVLWAAVKATLEQSERNICVIYTGLDPPPAPVPKGSKSQATEERIGEFSDVNRPASILAKVKARFGLEISDPNRVVFIYLSNRKYVDAATWPRFTLLLQALGSMWLAFEAVSTLTPDLFVDTMGYPFTYPIVSWIADVPIASYVHYPVISSDMVNAMLQGTPFGPWKFVKYIYWMLIVYAYTYVGSFVSVIMANSTWTTEHMRKQWWYGKDPVKHIQTLYPPCATQDLVSFDIETPRKAEVVYLAQFRPEKRHELVLQEFSKFLKDHKSGHETPKLVMIGSIRNDDDRSAVYNLRILAHELKLVEGQDYDVVLDAPWNVVVDRLGHASFGLNAMWNEHFGMVVVEYMAAGLVPIVHNSAGPKLDIVVPWTVSEKEDAELLPTGLLFVDDSDPNYDAAAAKADKSVGTLEETFAKAFGMNSKELQGYRARARASCSRFSDEQFAHRWNMRVEVLAKLQVLRSRSRRSQGSYD